MPCLVCNEASIPKGRDTRRDIPPSFCRGKLAGFSNSCHYFENAISIERIAMDDANDIVTFGLVVGTRAFFNPKLAADGRADLVSMLERRGYACVLPDAKATPNGAIESRTDAARCASVFQAHRGKIDGIIVSLPNFGDELGVVQTLEQAKLKVPVLVHAFDDDVDKVDISHRRDAFCGKVSVCNNLKQYGIQWTDTAEHTCGVDSAEFAADLDRFAAICRIVRGIRGSRIGQIGTRPGAFQTVRFSEKLLQKSGITVVPVDLSEIMAAAGRIRESSKEVQLKLARIREYGRIPSRIPAEHILRQAKLSVGIDRWMKENDCSASAIQCWESIQKNYGCATCLSMSLMGEDGRPSACEADVTGAVSMLALRLASGNAAGFLDWNNNYGTDRSMCVNTHCSNFPRSFIGGDVEISELDVLGATLGRENCFGAIKGKVKAGPMTFFRMDTDDELGSCHAYVGEGAFTDDPFPMDGGIAVCKIVQLRMMLRHITSEGYAHHVAMVRGECAAALHEATAKYLGWDVYWHNRTE
jgi:L-fucose isomerase-like protein